MGSSSSREKKVVILGGGYAGIAIAKKLDKNFDVVVIDAKDFFFHSVGAPRTLVNERFGSLITIPYTNLLRFGRVVHEWATNIDVNGNKVITSNGEHFYDYLVIGWPSFYLSPLFLASFFTNKKLFFFFHILILFSVVYSFSHGINCFISS